MAKTNLLVTVDFESFKIEKRPSYPPKPTSVSIKRPGEKVPKFYAWGHTGGGNTHSFEQGKAAVKEVWDSGLPLLFHNGKFDTEVAQEHMGLPIPSWERIHDTQFLLFLSDPYSRSLALKPSAERLLGMPPEERDLMYEWLVEHRIIKKNQKSKVGEHIAEVPGTVVRAYANGDVIRTEKLFKRLYPEICKRGMEQAYNRERRIMPIMMRNEQQGIHVNLPRLAKAALALEKSLKVADGYIQRRLRVPNLNVDSKEELGAAIKASKYSEGLMVTATGQMSVSKESLDAAITDKRLLHTLHYRARCANTLRSFVLGWYNQAKATGGTIHTSWHQTRNGDEGFLSGARTGRFSTDAPNLLAVTKKLGRKAGGAVHPDWIDVEELPHLRSFLLPDPGGVWGRRDYNQQEYRILAHFENGSLMEAYLKNPRTDVHQFVQDSLRDLIGLVLDRDNTKIINFGMLYGLGLKNLAVRLQRTIEEARTIKQAQLRALPGLKNIQDDLRDRDENRLPIRTWGGREYFAEEPRLIDGEWRRFGYKLLNYLIQGSAADCTKEALIRYDEAKGREARLLVAVHDEIDISAPKARLNKEMKLLRDVMQSVEFDVPMLSDGEYGPSWGEMKKWEEQ
jgi:DNA polymerase-1